MENDLDNWTNPINRVRGPKVSLKPLEPARAEDIKKLLSICGNDFYGLRDKAIILVLMDTGLRASELIDLNIEDVNPVTGVTVIRNGKGGKFRIAYLGKKSRQALRQYLKSQNAKEGSLFINRYDERIAYDSLRGL
jgi:integrase/recombinase XerD